MIQFIYGVYHSFCALSILFLKKYVKKHNFCTFSHAIPHEIPDTAHDTAAASLIRLPCCWHAADTLPRCWHTADILLIPPANPLRTPYSFHLFTSCFFAPLFAHFSAKRCNDRDGRKPLRLRIYPFDYKTGRKRCRKLSKKIEKNRKKGAVRTTHESTTDPRRKTLHLFAFFSQKAACTAAHSDFQFFSFRYKTCSKQ